MSEIVTNNPFLNDVVDVYKKLLDVTAENKFVIDTKDNIKEYLENLSIGNEKTGELLVSFTSNLASTTIAKTMDQSLVIVERSTKSVLENNLLQKQIDSEAKTIEIKTQQIIGVEKDNLIKDKQVIKLDEEIDLLESQDLELKESILDRQQKRPIEVANLTKQGNLIDKQMAKLSEDTLFVVSQKTSMLEQVQDNKKIKAMDSMADMIGTLGAGGLVPGTAILQTYFELNKGLTGTELPTSYTITKAV